MKYLGPISDEKDLVNKKYVDDRAGVSGVKGDSESSYRTGNVNITKGNLGLGNVENKSSATIRGELTKSNVTTALGYTPPTSDTNTTYSLTQDASDGHKITLTPSSGTAQTVTIPDNNTWRGIQNNLTSDSTTDSLSAAQGKALANGSARDSTKLPLTGGTVTGAVTFSSSVNGVTINKTTIVPFVKGTQTAITGTWTGVCNDVDSLYDGLTIAYWLPYKGSGSATLNLIINEVETGAKNCYYGGTTRLTTHYGAGSIIYLTYQSAANIAGTTYEGWWANANYDSNTKNTAGATDTSEKIFLVGATSQGTNPVTYSHDTAYVGTDGCLYSGGIKVLTAHQDISGKIDTAGTGLSKSGTTLSVKLGYTTSGNNRAVQADSSGNLYVVQKDDNTNNAVTQTATTTSANYEVLFSSTADNTTRTEGARKNSNLLFNPNTGNLQATQLNGVTIGSSPKFTDTNTTYSAGTGLSLSSTTFAVKLGYTTSGNNRAVQADSSGNLYVVQKDDNTTYSTMSSSEIKTGTATTQRVMTASELRSGILNLFYPVGSYYETSDTAFNPNNAWGGTWVLETEGLVHISAGSNYAVSGAPTDTKDGGSKDATLVSHSHTVNDHSHSIPSLSGTAYDAGYHNHAAQRAGNAGAGSNRYAMAAGSASYSTEYGGTHSHSVATNASTTGGSTPGTDSQGSSGTNANMMPYIIVNRWHRTA